MKKILILVCALLVAGPGVALAQAYYPNSGYSYGNYNSGYNYNNYNYGSGYQPAMPAHAGQAGGCVYISSNLSYGSRGSEVSSLQQFLVNQNYPGSGSWMVTGYFGRATESALRTFQANRGLYQSGVADVATRAALQANCYGGGFSGSLYNSYQYPYTAYQNPYQYPYYSYSYAPLRLNSLSTQNVNAGSSLTLYGTGFDRISNTIRIGANAAIGAKSTNGTSITVNVPSMQSGVYPVTVTNGRGVSNSLSLTVTGYSYNYYGYNYGNYYGNYYGNNYGNNYGCSNYSYQYGCY